MNRTSVVSSNVASVGYEKLNKILEIEFNDGSIYQYFKVPENIYENLMKAESKGKYLNKYIKKAGYSYKKIK